MDGSVQANPFGRRCYASSRTVHWSMSACQHIWQRPGSPENAVFIAYGSGDALMYTYYAALICVYVREKCSISNYMFEL